MSYKLVPKQLTDSMAKAIRNEHCVYQTEQELYDALLEAAPAAKDAEISELQQNLQTTADALGHEHLELAAMKGAA